MLIDTTKYEKPLLVVLLLLILAGVIWTAYSVGKNTTTTTVVTVTPTPTPTPTPTTDTWTNYQRVSTLTTSAGFPQVGFPDGRSFNVPWNIYDNLDLGDYVSFHTTGSYTPYGSVIYYADNVLYQNTYYNNRRTYGYTDWSSAHEYDHVGETHCGSAGCFYYDKSGKHSI